MYSKYYYIPEQLGGRLRMHRTGEPHRGELQEKYYHSEWILYYEYFVNGNGHKVTKVIGYKRSGDKFQISDGRTAIKYHPVPLNERRRVDALLGGDCEFHEKEE